MTYNPQIPRERYDNYGDREWTRLERDGFGELLYHVHTDVLRNRIKPSDLVFEIGAGPGRYTKDLVHMCRELTVADISSAQLEINRRKMAEFGCLDRVKAYHVLDVTDLGGIGDSSFDCVVCIGGVINYLLDQERRGIGEMLRVLKPGGILIVGAMSFIGAALFYLDGARQEKDMLGMEATKWLFATGIQDSEHYPVPSKHYVHMMRSAELDRLFAEFPVEVLERRSAGLFSQAKDPAIENARQDKEFWDFIMEREVEYSKLPGTLDCGMNLIYSLRKL